jgi:hypothetical protein
LPSMQLEIATGGDDLRGDSSTTVSALSNTHSTLQTFTLKPQNQPGFANNTIYQQMFGFNGTSTPQVGSISITLTSHNGFFETNDNWNIQGIMGQIFDAGGNPVCQFDGNGNPLMRLTGDVPTGVLSAGPCAPPPPPPVCQPPTTLCGNVCANLNSDPRNCGGCGKACDAGQRCSAGTCGCPAGTTLCCGGDLGCRKPGQCPKQCP